MIKYLEQRLLEKTKDSQSEILFAQWNYDKKVIPTALQSVSTLFPHYSLHDESHSITIINNIVRILGKENIDKLSAIDIWLILEASYSHDIGMVVSSQELINSINSKEFIEYFEDLINDKKNGLHEFARQFKIEDGKIKYQKNHLNLELHDGIKFILAEFFRRKHSDRSKDVINNPSGELALTSPRGVIPNRIFKILGDICASHTKNFDEVMKLPFCEVGIDVENAHPRFIACLLRVGDLLDLDNNRFSEVMLRTLSKIPVDTLNHKAKHLSIESFRVDREKIEVKAKCSDYDTANITQHWFNYLNSEISDQMINWNDIVPTKELGYLPTIGTLKVELSNYEYIDGKNKPKFSVDTDKALELLSGAGLYEGAYQCMREILQNAVDATLLRIWEENKNDLNFSSPQSQEFTDILKNNPIEIHLIEIGVENGFQNWQIKIKDNGTGISDEDLKFLMNTGSSSKNKKRQRIINEMPNWMKPSGIFGIGFQSIFLLSDSVKIETKSYFTEQFQIVELNGANTPRDGDILIQKKNSTHSKKPGTTINIRYKTKAIPSRYSIKGEHKNAMRIARNFDPFSHESMDIELGKVIDEIFDFAYKSYVPINLTIDNKKIETRKLKSKQFDYFDEETGLELNVLTGGINERWRTITYYKNQSAENRINFKFLGFEVNIHNDKASMVLTLNRNKIKTDYEDKLEEQILFSAFKIITENFDEIFKNKESKFLGSMFLDYYFENEIVKNFNIKKFNQWERFPVDVKSKVIPLKQLIDKIESLKIISGNKVFQTDLYSFENKKDLTITISHDQPSLDTTLFFLSKLSNHFSAVKKVKDNPEEKPQLVFTKGQQEDPVSSEELKSILKQGYYSSRIIVPCLKKYNNIRIKDDAYKSYIYKYPFDQNLNFPYPKMLSPFIHEDNFTEDKNLKLVLNEKLYDWVFENRYDEKITLEGIKEGYEEFLQEFDLKVLSEE